MGLGSNDLKINVGKREDSIMNISIQDPVCGKYYTVGDTEMITVFASDPDDKIFGNISINGDIIKSFTNGGTSFSYTYDVAGNITLIADSIGSREKRWRTVSNIMVLDKSGDSYLDGTYVAACIDSPKDFSRMGSDVLFNASTTRGIKIIGGTAKELIPGQDKFDWHWGFEPGNLKVDFYDSLDRNAYIFGAHFPNSGDNSATLTVEI